MEAETITHQNCTQKEQLEEIKNRLNDMSTKLENRYSQSRRCAMQEKPMQQLMRAAEDFGITHRDRVDIEGAEAAIENLWRSIDGECHGLDKTMPSFQDYMSAKAALIKAQAIAFLLDDLWVGPGMMARRAARKEAEAESIMR
ncbi:hypothetical protein FRC04_006122 [Tulasnella sp. 424]|nr:hypothetical protein FRC04_006122 [Tulasnella sp. 424]